MKAFGGRVHFSVGAGMSAAAGPVGRAAEADVRAGDGGAAACYTYSCSKGLALSIFLEVQLPVPILPLHHFLHMVHFDCLDVQVHDWMCVIVAIACLAELTNLMFYG